MFITYGMLSKLEFKEIETFEAEQELAGRELTLHEL
jgi:hypothetical protein